VSLLKLHRVATVVPLLLFAPLAAFAQSPSSVGVVTALSGSADVIRANQPGNPAPLKFRDALFLRDKIRTKEESLVRVLLGGKAVMTIRERTELTITEDPGRPTIVEVASGKVALGVARQRMKPGEAIEVRTPNAIAAVRGTFLIVEVTPAATGQTGPGASTFATSVHVLTGIVDVSAGAQQVRVTNLQSVTATGANLGQLRQLSQAEARQLTQPFSGSPQASAPPQHTLTPPAAVQRTVIDHHVDQFNRLGRAIAGVDERPRGSARRDEILDASGDDATEPGSDGPRMKLGGAGNGLNLGNGLSGLNVADGNNGRHLGQLPARANVADKDKSNRGGGKKKP
jgi:hypothetical protein